MGRNKRLKDRIATLKRRIQLHEDKKRRERRKTSPDLSVIEHWEAEIDTGNTKSGRLRTGSKGKGDSMATKNHPAAEVTHKTVETLLKEVSEQSRNYERALKRLLREKPGTESYEGNLGKVWAEADVLATKAEDATIVIDQYSDAVPD